MALVILTEPNPYQAGGVILRRLAFLLLPLSVLFIRYFPDLGRSYHVDGSPMYTGVGHQKNDLGLMCLITGIYFAWNFLRYRTAGYKLLVKENGTDFLLILMLLWLLRMSNSQTSLVCIIVTIGILFTTRIGFIAKQPSRIVGLGGLGALLFAVLESTLHIKDFVLELLGRDPTLTNRTEVWEVLSRFEVNAMIGAGFMSFWSGRRLEGIWAILGTGINQAHNGYLEQYFNLGYVGVAFIAVIILSGLVKVRKRLDIDYPSSILRLCIIVSAVFYNYTEAAFYGVSNMWLLLMFAVIEMPEQQINSSWERQAYSPKTEKPLLLPFYRYRRKLSEPELK
jgi:O-antigen ligase